jgi:hypothetical protein
MRALDDALEAEDWTPLAQNENRHDSKSGWAIFHRKIGSLSQITVHRRNQESVQLSLEKSNFLSIDDFPFEPYQKKETKISFSEYKTGWNDGFFPKSCFKIKSSRSIG